MAKKATKLREARALISDEKSWVKQAAGLNKRGYALLTPNPAAVKFCMIGALWQVAGSWEGSADTTTLRTVTHLLGDPNAFSITEYNDALDTTHDDVLWALDLAIAFTEVGL